jgi:hypothetical protein
VRPSDVTSRPVVRCSPVTSTESSKLVTKNPRSAVRLLVSYVRLVAKSGIVEDRFDRRILVTESPKLVLTEDEILSPLLLEN